MPRRPDVDYTALPLPTNLPAPATGAYQALMRALNERNALERRLDALKDEITGHREWVLDQVCPVRANGELPIDRNVVVEAAERHLTIVEDPAQPGSDVMVMRWSVEGPRVSFKDGVITRGQTVTVEQAAYEALPDAVKAQTRDSIRAASALVVNLDKPLSWTEPVTSLFDHLEQRFQGTPPDASVALPSPVWNNDSQTRRIYLGLVKQGVIELAPHPGGKETTPSTMLNRWYVRRGPRYDAFVEAIGQERTHKLAQAQAERSARTRRPR